MNRIVDLNGRYHRWLPNRWDLLGLWFAPEIRASKFLSSEEMTAWFQVEVVS